ncbi:MAG: hypothetical protein V8Q54_07545 [Alistipes senegalensis]
MTRSYSHYAPYKFWCAHQQELNPDGVFDRLLRKAHQNDMFQKALAGKSPNCVPQQQWTNDLFRDFFLWSTSRALDLLPELDGFLNAYAEAAWTYDIEKVRSDTWKSWKECVDYDKTDSCFVDYSNRLAHMLREKRGDDWFFGMRDWYVKPEVMQQLDIPREKLVSRSNTPDTTSRWSTIRPGASRCSTRVTEWCWTCTSTTRSIRTRSTGTTTTS